MKSNNVVPELRQILGDDAVLTDPSELYVYDCDGFTIARNIPRAVVFPTSTDQVVRVIKCLVRNDVPIVPRGSGTGLTGGCVAYENGIVVSLARMNRILQIDLDNRVALVEPGVRNLALSDAVALVPGGDAYHFAPDPSSQRSSSIGGNASTNAGGIHTLKDFVTSNHILGLELVLADGSIVEIGARNGAYESGPFDLPGLVCGAEGTFGMITKLWVRLVPKPRNFRTIVGIFSTTADACNVVSDTIAAGILPAAMELLDGRMVEIIEAAFHFGFSKDAQALVLTEIDGIEDLLDGQMEQIIAFHKKHNAISIDASEDPAARAKLWKARKSAFGAIGRISPSYCTQDACIPRSMLAPALARIDEIGKKYGLLINNVFHAGDGNVHPIFLYDDRSEEQIHNTLLAAEEVLKYCIDIGGTLTGEHGVGVEKIQLMPYMFDRPTLDQFYRVKNAFDPQERINAGKLLPSEKIQVDLLKPGRHVPQ